MEINKGNWIFFVIPLLLVLLQNSSEKKFKVKGAYTARGRDANSCVA